VQGQAPDRIVDAQTRFRDRSRQPLVLGEEGVWRWVPICRPSSPRTRGWRLRSRKRVCRDRSRQPLVLGEEGRQIGTQRHTGGAGQRREIEDEVENAIAGDAFRPGDVIRSRAGLTVEIGNTDAEGRLILADALALADAEAPDLILDFATLTGAR
jgi:hypothetical protein